jgi:hypothetical protein
MQGGERKIRLKLAGKLQVDIVMCTPGEFGACLMYLTGPYKYNIEMRAEAKALGMKLNEKGLWSGDNYVAGATERGIFAALRLKYCTPPGRTELKTFAKDVAWRTEVIGSKGDKYEVSLNRDGSWHCPCKGYKFTKKRPRTCSHIEKKAKPKHEAEAA